MITIYKMSDRIPVKIGPVEFLISPISSMHKQEIISQASMKAEEGTVNELAMAHNCIKYQVKGIKGVRCSDGKPYEVEMNGDGLTDDCVSEILQLEQSNKLITALAAMLSGIKDPNIKGVEVKLPKAKN